MPRGRLLNPFLIELGQLDTAATETAAGYDPVWRTVKTTYVDGERLKGAAYKTPTLKVRAQVEVTSHRTQQQQAAGNVPGSRYTLVLHFTELETRSLLDPSGEPTLRVNDQLRAIHTLDGVLVQTFDPPLYVTEVQTSGFGIGKRRNLCILTVADRPQAARS